MLNGKLNEEFERKNSQYSNVKSKTSHQNRNISTYNQTNSFDMTTNLMIEVKSEALNNK
jgi:hypothetical protein